MMLLIRDTTIEASKKKETLIFVCEYEHMNLETCQILGQFWYFKKDKCIPQEPEI
jgi:hypothetical protein